MRDFHGLEALNMSYRKEGPAGEPSRIKIGMIIAAGACVFLWLSFASKIPASSDKADMTEAPAEVSAPRPGDTVRVGGRAIVTTAFAACKDRSDIRKIKSLMLEGDKEAAAKYADQQSCTAFDEGDIGKVEDLSLWSGTTCIRKDGEPECYWFPTPYLEAQGQARDEQAEREPDGYATGGAFACAKFEDIKGFYDAITTGSSRPDEIFAKARRSCIEMGEGWPVSILRDGKDHYTHFESPGNFEGQMWTSSLSITSGRRN